MVDGGPNLQEVSRTSESQVDAAVDGPDSPAEEADHRQGADDLSCGSAEGRPRATPPVPVQKTMREIRADAVTPPSRALQRPATPPARGPVTLPNRPNEGELEALAVARLLESLPQSGQGAGPSRRAPTLSFVLLVVIPTVLVGLYYAFMASDQYMSEFRFAVTQSDPSSSIPQATGSVSTTSTILSSLGGASGSPQNYVVVDYLTSQQAIDDISKVLDLTKIYSRPSIDYLSRFDPHGTKEQFASYWRNLVTTDYDPVTGIAMAQVRAFSPEDAKKIATELVDLSEALVNRIASRTQLDAVKFAEGEVAKAQTRLTDVRARLLAYRTQEGLIDPTSSSVPTNVDLVKQMRGNLLQLQTQLGALGLQDVNAKAPTSRALQAQIAAAKAQLATVESEVARDRDGSRALAETVARFESLDLDRQYAQNALVATKAALDQARANAAAQHLYLTPYVQPNLPDSSTYPRSVRNTLLCGLALFAMWLCGLILFRAVRDHAR